MTTHLVDEDKPTHSVCGTRIAGVHDTKKLKRVTCYKCLLQIISNMKEKSNEQSRQADPPAK